MSCPHCDCACVDCGKCGLVAAATPTTQERKIGVSDVSEIDFETGNIELHPAVAPPREEVRELADALRKVNDLQHRMAIEFDAIPQQPRIEFWTRKMEEVICAALAATPTLRVQP